MCAKGLGVVHIKFQQRIPFELPEAAVLTKSFLEIAPRPRHRRVIYGYHIARSLGNIISLVEVCTQVGQEMEFIVELDVYKRQVLHGVTISRRGPT